MSKNAANTTPKSERNLLLKCHGCKGQLDLPYVFQSCQHVVCSSCANGKRSIQHCPKCDNDAKENNIYERFGLYTGKSDQLVSLVRFVNKPSTDAAVRRLRKTNPGAYARSMIKREIDFFSSIIPKPNHSSVNKKKKRGGGGGNSGLFCRCFSLCCYPCSASARAFSRILKFCWTLMKELLFVTLFLIFFILLIFLSDLMYPGIMQSAAEAMQTNPEASGLIVLACFIVYIVGKVALRCIRNSDSLQMESSKTRKGNVNSSSGGVGEGLSDWDSGAEDISPNGSESESESEEEAHEESNNFYDEEKNPAHHNQGSIASRVRRRSLHRQEFLPTIKKIPNRKDGKPRGRRRKHK